MKEDILNLYRLLHTQYGKSKELAIEITTRHYYFKVCDLMSELEFRKRITKLINKG